MDILMIYLLTVNAAGFLIMRADKQKARNSNWRIPESILFLVALMGGSLGCYVGMYTFRHKTKHWQFAVGMPVILILQAAAAVYGLYLLEL